MVNLNQLKSKWLFLLVGSLSILLSGPVFQINLAGWLIPIGITYFLRNSKLGKGYLITTLFIFIFSSISGIFSSVLPPVAVIIFSFIAVFLDGIPYVIDRIFYNKIPSKWSVLLLPSVAVSYEFIMSFALSSIGALAATQTGFYTFMQLASVLGVYSLSFMMYWFASVLVSWLMKEPSSIQTLRFYAIVISVVFIYGTIKPRLVDPTEPTVKVSGIVLEEYDLYEEIYEAYYGEEVSFDISTSDSPELGKMNAALMEYVKNPEEERFTSVGQALADFEDQILGLTLQEARNGAIFIVWSETNLGVFQDEEERVLERVARIARQEQAYIYTAMAVLLPYQEGGPMYQNKSILIDPEGDILDAYEKAKPVPFLDASLPGDGLLKLTQTPYGIVTGAICYDADFPELMAQSGNADILFLPSNDWLGISPYHGNNAIFRAIENGVSIIRPTGTGQSIIIDPHGKVLARVDAFDQISRVINAYVPVKGVRTIYNLIGNAFVWISLIGAIALIGASLSARRHSKH